jgi:hypothetical protein
MHNEVNEISGGTQILRPPPAPDPQACLNGSAEWIAPQQRLGGKRAIQKALLGAISEHGGRRRGAIRSKEFCGGQWRFAAVACAV